MNLPARFPGLSVSEGRASGTVRVVGTDMTVSATADEVAAAFVAVAAERSALAARLRSAGRAQEADIIEVAALIAADPALTEPAIAAVRGGENAAAAVSEAAEKQAVVMEGLANRALAERAGDIRQIARAVLDYLGTDGMALPDEDFILDRFNLTGLNSEVSNYPRSHHREPRCAPIPFPRVIISPEPQMTSCRTTCGAPSTSRRASYTAWSTRDGSSPPKWSVPASPLTPTHSRPQVDKYKRGDFGCYDTPDRYPSPSD